MFSPLGKAIVFAVSPRGRKAIRHAVRVARSEEGRKVIAQARKVATGPEARKLVEQAKRVAVRVSEQAKTPENAQRIDQLKQAVRSRMR